MKNPCPCCSQIEYDQCCGKFHLGDLPDTALQLMRSRYSAYKLNLPDYIMATTHPKNPTYSQDKEEWRQNITQFSKNTLFHKLEIHDYQEEDPTSATVTFTAYLTQGNRDASFTEKSSFEKVEGCWLYKGYRIKNSSS